MAHRKSSFRTILLLGLWLSLVCGGTVLMTRYANLPGTSAPAPGSWPAGSRIPIDSSRATLLMFVHPRCPCSRASLGELDRLLAEIPALPKVFVVFVQPKGTSPEWAQAELWRSAAAIRGVSTFLDKDGVEARRFGAETSGETLLYDRAGELKFAGGITVARGHSGDNAGETSLRELLDNGHPAQKQTPVYGCALFDDQCQKGEPVCKP